MRRLPLAAAGILLGFLAATLTLGAGLVVAALWTPAQTSLAIAQAAALLLAQWQAGAGPDVARLTLRLLWWSVILVCFMPVAVTAVVCEAARVRSLLWYAGASAGLAALLPLALRLAREDAASAALSHGEARLTALLVLVGAAGGSVCGLVVRAFGEDLR